VELDGADHLAFAGDVDHAVDLIQEFVTGAPATPSLDRLLATIVFTDIVDSTARAASLGDRAWKAILDSHDDTASRLVQRFHGRQVKQTGDGILAIFDGPTGAISASVAMRDAFHAANLEIRCGVHTAEVERRGSDVGGIGVHVAARIAALGDAGDVLVTGTVTDLVAGSGLHFTDRGEHTLKGVPGTWRVHAVSSAP
jgi:class 3 adenylate cyclase